MKDIIIKEIEDNSIAQELDIEEGDVLVSVNGIKPRDILEYKYLTDDDFLVIEIKKKSGHIWEIEIEKDYDEKIGLIFKDEIIDNPLHCHNNCVFCFINQLPKGMRNTLYFKDDDTRLSFIYGNYVTLTNLSDEDINRIIKYRIQPINISVHTTNPKLRVKMLNNEKASNINIILKKFYNNKINMKIQIVLVPGYNDGVELKNTLKDLMKLFPYINSVSVVPVGLTKYRDNQVELRNFNNEECRDVIKTIEGFQEIMKKKYNTNFIFPSDEFFFSASKDIPDEKYYEDFSLLENGVGMVSCFYNQCMDALNGKYINVRKKDINILTGSLAFDMIKKITDKVKDKYPEININVYVIINNFFGDKITVSGLITGCDIINQMKDHKLNGNVLIPSNMLRYEQDKFLDDISLEDISKALNTTIIPTEVEGHKFIHKLLY
ncbi:MAG: DUF512 domain-containing protein [Eubacteriaceae bacterium]